MKELFSTLLPYYRPYRWPALAGLVLVVVAQGFTIATPYLVKEAIDGLADPGLGSDRLRFLAALIVVVDDLVVYKVWDGTPLIDAEITKKNPLGPLQEPATLVEDAALVGTM